MIDGDPGAGKTTFIKRLCYIWAQNVLHPRERQTESFLHPVEREAKSDLNSVESEAESVVNSIEREAENSTEGWEAEYIQKYIFVIPIILRLLSDEITIMEILKAQLKCLRIHEICALVRVLENQSSKLLLLFDGYDEYKGHSKFIANVINKDECADILTFTTSRPHAVEQLKRHTSQAVNQHVRLCGFSKKQVKQYVRQFFEYYELPPTEGEELTRILLEERPDILEVAKIPVRAEMVCTVWAFYGKLGKNLADVYELFVIHSIQRWENKEKAVTVHKNKKPLEEVIKQSTPLLLKVGKLANSWEKHNKLRTVFSTEELQDILDEDFDKVINMGILTKSHPSYILHDIKWSFPHLTIQEYFVAYFLQNTDDSKSINEFASRCKGTKYYKDVILSLRFCAPSILMWLTKY